MSLIELEGISKTYKTGKISFEALRGVDLKIEKGESLSIIGPSGSGKSTLMHIIGLLDKPTKGNYLLDGKNINRHNSNKLAVLRNQKIGFVFQSFHLLQGSTAWENVALPLAYSRKNNKQKKEKAMKYLDLVGLKRWASHKSNELSGGQMQRVAIARSLVNDPEIILADEPTGNLDSKTGEEILKILEEQKQRGITVILVTHDPEISKRTDKTIKILDGNIVK
ncbi:macrolide ABC transporter ATP-binding protein [bacterium]|nr:macrolide ABC transporter ATP-binding protein [bacterium]|tara:strand:- start:55897 stop:56565 length:669 start_codon:yes stop_codon:yes gene_type:complete